MFVKIAVVCMVAIFIGSADALKSKYLKLFLERFVVFIKRYNKFQHLIKALKRPIWYRKNLYPVIKRFIFKKGRAVQNFFSESNLNDQIKMEMEAAQIYLSMVYYQLSFFNLIQIYLFIFLLKSQAILPMTPLPLMG